MRLSPFLKSMGDITNTTSMFYMTNALVEARVERGLTVICNWRQIQSFESGLQASAERSLSRGSISKITFQLFPPCTTHN